MPSQSPSYAAVPEPGYPSRFPASTVVDGGSSSPGMPHPESQARYDDTGMSANRGKRPPPARPAPLASQAIPPFHSFAAENQGRRDFGAEFQQPRPRGQPQDCPSPATQVVAPSTRAPPRPMFADSQRAPGSGSKIQNLLDRKLTSRSPAQSPAPGVGGGGSSGQYMPQPNRPNTYPPQYENRGAFPPRQYNNEPEFHEPYSEEKPAQYYHYGNNEHEPTSGAPDRYPRSQHNPYPAATQPDSDSFRDAEHRRDGIDPDAYGGPPTQNGAYYEDERSPATGHRSYNASSLHDYDYRDARRSDQNHQEHRSVGENSMGSESNEWGDMLQEPPRRR
jgi:hypothetical protein